MIATQATKLFEVTQFLQCITLPSWVAGYTKWLIAVDLTFFTVRKHEHENMHLPLFGNYLRMWRYKIQWDLV